MLYTVKDVAPTVCNYSGINSLELFSVDHDFLNFLQNSKIETFNFSSKFLIR